MVTLEDLDDTVNKIKVLAEEMRSKLYPDYPDGKPDWMPQSDWNDMNWDKEIK